MLSLVFRGVLLFVIILNAIQFRNCQDFFSIPSRYSRSKAPIPKGSPLIVDVDIWVWAVTEVSAQRMEIKVDMYIQFEWFDNRLDFTSTLIPDQKGWFPVGDMKHKIWMPYVTFRNCVGCTPVDLDPQKNDVLVHPISHRFKISTRTLTTFSCNINLAKYPMDSQQCRMQLANYHEDISEIQFVHIFPDSYKQVASNQTLAEYQIAYITSGNCSYPVYDGTIFACIEVNFLFIRQLGYYVCTLYAPTFLLVILSWMGFWIPPDPLPARITLGVTALLTLATRLDQSQKNLPPVSYVKAIDVWLFVCVFLVFASLIELAVTITYLQKQKLKVIPISVTTASNTESQEANKKSKSKKIISQSFCVDGNVPLPDRVARILFPSVFILFNIIYWAKYMS